jgi:hypothetical protein
MKGSKRGVIPLKSMMGGALLSIFVVGFLVNGCDIVGE